MKIVYTILAAVILMAKVVAQSPNKMSYQAVIRNSSDQLVINQTVGMRISILQDSVNGTPVYVQTKTATTNTNGLVSIEIGKETGFDTINWAKGLFFIKTETDPEGGTSYTITGTSQILSVPYALHAKTAEAITDAHFIGELYGGGVVFWIDHTGKHGLILSMIDLSAGHTWSNVSITLLETTNHWDGASNTANIIGQVGHTTSAAKLCVDYTNNDYGTGIYSDWYLPSIAELNHVWNNFYEVQKALTSDNNPATTPINIEDNYFSSSEYDFSLVWILDFYGGFINTRSKNINQYIRAVRAF